ncbi:GspH/FimT family pseudopilin [Comamonas sp. J-3]|uniref:GspH/FimT family pseudopilin n=1 Tax=Comamonas trifloxystrobinivorans TaxID=3350256 RepID=UPI003729102C
MLSLHATASAKHARGMTLVELMIGVVIVASVLALGMPSMALWMKNSRIRSAAEVMQNSLQTARAEAVRRNEVVRVQLVDTIGNDCNLNANGRFWVTNLGAGNNAAASCGQATGDNQDAKILQKGALSTATNVSVTASQTVYAFNGLGQQAATTNPTINPPNALTVEFTAAEGSCIKDGGDVRCLNVIVSPAGQVRMCDSAISTRGDALTC